MDEDMGGGEGVASSDDVNDISSAAQEVLSTGIRYLHILEVLVLLGFCLFLNWQIFQFKHSRSRGCRYIQQRPNRGYTDIFNRQRTGSITFILYHSTTATSKWVGIISYRISIGLNINFQKVSEFLFVQIWWCWYVRDGGCRRYNANCKRVYAPAHYDSKRIGFAFTHLHSK